MLAVLKLIFDIEPLLIVTPTSSTRQPGENEPTAQPSFLDATSGRPSLIGVAVCMQYYDCTEYLSVTFKGAGFMVAYSFNGCLHSCGRLVGLGETSLKILFEFFLLLFRRVVYILFLTNTLLMYFF